MNRREFMRGLTASAAMAAALPAIAGAIEPANIMIGIDLAGGPDCCGVAVRSGDLGHFTYSFFSIVDGQVREQPPQRF